MSSQEFHGTEKIEKSEKSEIVDVKNENEFLDAAEFGHKRKSSFPLVKGRRKRSNVSVSDEDMIDVLSDLNSNAKKETRFTKVLSGGKVRRKSFGIKKKMLEDNRVSRDMLMPFSKNAVRRFSIGEQSFSSDDDLDFLKELEIRQSIQSKQAEKNSGYDLDNDNLDHLDQSEVDGFVNVMYSQVEFSLFKELIFEKGNICFSLVHKQAGTWNFKFDNVNELTKSCSLLFRPLNYGKVYLLPLHSDSDLISTNDIFDFIHSFFASSSIAQKICFNFGNILNALQTIRFEHFILQNIFDIQIAFWIIDPFLKDYSLNKLSDEYIEQDEDSETLSVSNLFDHFGELNERVKFLSKNFSNFSEWMKKVTEYLDLVFSMKKTIVLNESIDSYKSNIDDYIKSWKKDEINSNFKSVNIRTVKKKLRELNMHEYLYLFEKKYIDTVDNSIPGEIKSLIEFYNSSLKLDVLKKLDQKAEACLNITYKISAHSIESNLDDIIDYRLFDLFSSNSKIVYAKIDYFNLFIFGHMSQDETILSLLDDFISQENFFIRLTNLCFDDKDSDKPKLENIKSVFELTAIGYTSREIAEETSIEISSVILINKKILAKCNTIQAFLETNKKKASSSGFSSTIFGREYHLSQYDDLFIQKKKNYLATLTKGSLIDTIRELTKSLHQNYQYSSDTNLLLLSQHHILLETTEESLPHIESFIQHTLHSLTNIPIPFHFQIKQTPN